MSLKKLKERLNIFVVKRPDMAILILILVWNVLFFIVAALVISALAPPSLKENGFWVSVFYTVSMILDAGCISFVVEDVGEAGVALIIACLVTVVIGMITFTGAVIGYVTNMISNFVENSKSGKRSLKISGHTVILNWNSRASEIINDLLYTGRREVVVILVTDGAEAIEREISDRISDTLKRENIKNRLSIIVREGDTVSSKQLSDISLLTAKNVIILSKDVQNLSCKFDYAERVERMEHGNANTIKTLVQVSEITSSHESADNQIIVVEVEDSGTLELVNRVIAHKERLSKCNIIPVPVNRILGQILSQFSIMPELNTVYSDLFSNKGAEFFCADYKSNGNEEQEIRDFMEIRQEAIPLAAMGTKSGPQAFFVAENESDVNKTVPGQWPTIDVEINYDYWLEQRNIVIVGHNSKCVEIMNGFNSFRNEWNFRDGREILNIMVIDDRKSLEKLHFYEEYPYVNECVVAEVFDSETICSSIERFVDSHDGDTSILILSDDNAYSDDIDANALTYLIYVQGIVSRRIEEDPSYEIGSIDIIVEILDPKNYDVAHNFSANNVVISNRYISKMVTQISEKSALFEFYQDILTYDDAFDEMEGDRVYDSKELYIKKVGQFFRKVPGECTAAQLIRAVYDATPVNDKAIILGYVDLSGTMHLFSGDQNKIKVRFSPKDKLILFSAH